MTDMRDKIATIVWLHKDYNEVIRGMVKPLVWEAGDGFTASDEYLTADNGMGGGYWTMEGELGCSFDFDTFNDVFFDGDFEAQAAANEHNANTILAALGLTEGMNE